jgi:dTDP-4-amino-4,6-dideoxygalactose transaminase
MDLISYGRHDVSEEDIKLVNEVLRSGNLTMGSFVDQFESELANFTKTAGAIAVSSGTAALHCAYSTINLKGKEVITSPMTFVATASTAVLQGANIKFCDVEAVTGNINPDEIRSLVNSKTAVVTSVAYAGNPVDVSRIKTAVKDKDILVFDDASHALGSKFSGKMVGEEADLTIFSFFPTKNITSGEGGAVVSNNLKLLSKARTFKMHGLVREKSKLRNPSEGDWHQEVHNFGLNYRLSDIHAALGLSQLKKINEFKSIRDNIFNFYTKTLSPIDEIELPAKTPGSDPFWHLFPIRVPKDTRKKLFDYLRTKGIIVQVNYIPVYLHPVFQDLGYKKGLCPNAEDFYEREISLPLHTKLNKSNLEYITECLHEFFK